MGGGGHSALIHERLTTGKLIGIDRDSDAIAAATARLAAGNIVDMRCELSRHLEVGLGVAATFTPVNGNFFEMRGILDGLGIAKVDGILLDLGVSSYQIDTPQRGFSFMRDGPLDMRMSKNAATTARDIINNFSEKDLIKIFFDFGEERFSRKIARAICVAREATPIETTLQLAGIIEKAVPKKWKRDAFEKSPHPAMRTFMALRIVVNDELAPLDAALRSAVSCLAKNGRIAVITFHSLEDRIVKTTFAKLANPCECPRDIPYCACGKVPALRLVTRKPITPSADEIQENSRAHSAKLRIAEAL